MEICRNYNSPGTETLYLETNAQHFSEVLAPVGIDVGLDKLATLSDGNYFKKDPIYRDEIAQFKKAERKLSTTVQNTKSYEKAISHLHHRYKRVVNRRKEMVEKVSLDIVKRYNMIIMEDLDIRQLRSRSMSSGLNISYNDCSLGLLRQRIFCKAMEAGRTIVLVDPRNTSQMCSGCGHIVHKELSDRVHYCPYCKLTMDRDLNASLNILHRGLTNNPSLVMQGRIASSE